MAASVQISPRADSLLIADNAGARDRVQSLLSDLLGGAGVDAFDDVSLSSLDDLPGGNASFQSVLRHYSSSQESDTSDTGQHAKTGTSERKACDPASSSVAATLTPPLEKTREIISLVAAIPSAADDVTAYDLPAAVTTLETNGTGADQTPTLTPQTSTARGVQRAEPRLAAPLSTAPVASTIQTSTIQKSTIQTQSTGSLSAPVGTELLGTEPLGTEPRPTVGTPMVPIQYVVGRSEETRMPAEALGPAPEASSNHTRKEAPETPSLAPVPRLPQDRATVRGQAPEISREIDAPQSRVEPRTGDRRSAQPTPQASIEPPAKDTGIVQPLDPSVPDDRGTPVIVTGRFAGPAAMPSPTPEAPPAQPIVAPAVDPPIAVARQVPDAAQRSTDFAGQPDQNDVRSNADSPVSDVSPSLKSENTPSTASDPPESVRDADLGGSPRRPDVPQSRATRVEPVRALETTRETLAPAPVMRSPQDRIPAPDGIAAPDPTFNIPSETHVSPRAVVRDTIASDPAPQLEDRPTPQPLLEPQAGTTQGAQPGELAFAARLSPLESTPATTVVASVPDSVKSELPAATPTPAVQKQVTESSPAPAETAVPGNKSGASSLVERFAKPDAIPPQGPPAPQNPPTVPARNPAPAASVPPAARMEQVMEPPATPPSSGRDITVRVPDATERGTDVRFVERGGEVRVSVRTADTELAQTLRSGLGDFVGRLEHNGIQAEIWSPGSGASSSQNDSQNQPADQNSSGQGRSGPQDQEHEHQDANQPQWVEELETTIGKPNSEEVKEPVWTFRA